MLSDLRQFDPAHDLLKQALISQNKNLDVRAAYTHFLIQTGMWKEAKGFVYATLNDVDKGDIYALCASACIMYHQARESRDASPKGIQERQKGFQRAAEFYGKALHLDPTCVVAAQGLAIVIAEDALGTLGGALPPGPSADDTSKRTKNARDALDVLTKVRESMNDGSVYVNMGHCYYNKDEYERAIESVRITS
jgi:RNA polymerase-associated protein CTR9